MKKKDLWFYRQNVVLRNSFSHISYNGYGAKIKPINTGVI